MLHYISWTRIDRVDYSYLVSSAGLGVRAYYAWNQTQGEWFLYPIIDDNHKTVFYYAFDTDAQMERCLAMAKVAWVWPKLAFALSNTNESDLRDAVATMDMKFLQSIPGIGPKLAKRLLVELKDSLTTDDIAKLTIDRTLYRDIVSTLTNLGYKTTKVDLILQSCPHELIRAHLWEIMKYVITQIS